MGAGGGAKWLNPIFGEFCPLRLMVLLQRWLVLHFCFSVWLLFPSRDEGWLYVTSVSQCVRELYFVEKRTVTLPRPSQFPLGCSLVSAAASGVLEASLLSNELSVCFPSPNTATSGGGAGLLLPAPSGLVHTRVTRLPHSDGPSLCLKFCCCHLDSFSHLIFELVFCK